MSALRPTLMPSERLIGIAQKILALGHLVHCAAQADVHGVIGMPDDAERRSDILNGVSLILEDTHAELEAAYDAISNEPEGGEA